MTSTVAGIERTLFPAPESLPASANGPASANAEDPVVARRQGPGRKSYAAEVPAAELPVLDDFVSEEDDEDEAEDVDDLDDDGELLDEEPRLSLR
ncbi:hypothetical protein GCM10010251_21460 [Streptomyces aurantiogriseus]|uniref:Uncharacterized protein n=1 Tax=Streptomyces aurantiogriseus TaxID=66870 RepID=A0A918F561_9ACTN|nr:hypothetical protein GCM10010251_21460 [Streptomyces aurantiogriseus]